MRYCYQHHPNASYIRSPPSVNLPNYLSHGSYTILTLQKPSHPSLHSSTSSHLRPIVTNTIRTLPISPCILRTLLVPSLLSVNLPNCAHTFLTVLIPSLLCQNLLSSPYTLLPPHTFVTTLPARCLLLPTPSERFIYVHHLPQTFLTLPTLS